jgi:hypothetical protein
MFPTTLPRRYAPAASVQSPYLSLSGCQLLSQGGPRVRQARHRRRQQTLRRQRCTAWDIGGCDRHCDATTMHSPTAFHTDAQRGRDVRYAHTIINAHHYNSQALRARGKRAVALPHAFGLKAKLLSQGRPGDGVRLARHQRRLKALRRQHGISSVGRHCDDNDAQPDTSAAATSTANTTMHNPTAFHTASVTATCATLARLPTRTT